MRSKLLGVFCVAVLAMTLSLGLWPFHAPPNDVTWLKRASGLTLGRYGSVLSTGALDAGYSQSDSSVEIWVQPNRWVTSATFLSLYRPDHGFLFTLTQSLTDLEVAVDIENGSEQVTANFIVDQALGQALWQKELVFVSLASGREGTMVYVDGVLAKSAPGFLIPALNGHVIVGDSPRQPNSFRGQICGLAIYGAQLSGVQVLQHYRTWTQTGRPEVTPEERNMALYLFDEHTGNTVRNQAANGADLHIPKTYGVVDKVALEPFWKEFDFSRSYWSGNFKNVIGFMPAGFCLFAYFTVAHPIKKALPMTLFLGLAVSLTIEILQIFLPTRDSGTTDLFTNTLGTYFGVWCYKSVYPALVERFPKLNWFAP